MSIPSSVTSDLQAAVTGACRRCTAGGSPGGCRGRAAGRRPSDRRRPGSAARRRDTGAAGTAAVRSADAPGRRRPGAPGPEGAEVGGWG